MAVKRDAKASLVRGPGTCVWGQVASRGGPAWWVSVWDPRAGWGWGCCCGIVTSDVTSLYKQSRAGLLKLRASSFQQTLNVI